MPNSLRSRGLQQARLPCPSLAPECAQTHVHWIDDAIQPSHPLSPLSAPGLSLSQHQSLFQWVSSLYSGGQSTGASASASDLPMNVEGWFPLGLTDLILQSWGLLWVFSSITVWKHQFFGAQPSLWSNVIATLDDYRVMPTSGASIQSPVLPSLLPSGSHLHCALRLSKSCGCLIFW